MSKQFLGVLIAIILAFVGIFVVTSSNSDSKSGSSKASGASVSQNVIGAGTTGVTLVEYGDYQCPYCQQYYPTVKQVQAEFGDKIKFQFSNFPLSNIHKNAFAASRAAQAAALQGKFWEMHDALYESNDPNGQSGWVAANDPNTFFDQFAKQIGLNVAKYKTDFASSAVNDTINADIAAGTKLNVTGTPAFFINGKKTEIANSVDAFNKVINEAIAKQAASAKQN
ncbi:MAG: thioredoxin domain-containing protein [Patescibacteria group bacterium]